MINIIDLRDQINSINREINGLSESEIFGYLNKYGEIEMLDIKQGVEIKLFRYRSRAGREAAFYIKEGKIFIAHSHE